MAPAPGRLGGEVKMPVQVRMLPEEIATVDTFASELSQQSYGAAFSRAEALRIAAMEWLKERQARRASVTCLVKIFKLVFS
jgi:predicted DNA-binding ribbon-helix-helix protein